MASIFRSGCAACRGSLWEYAEERLSEGSLEMVERHLAGCSRCRAELVAVRRSYIALAAYKSADVPEPRSDWEILRVRLEPIAAARAATCLRAAVAVETATTRSSFSSSRISSLLFAGSAGMFLATAAIGYRNAPTSRGFGPSADHRLPSEGGALAATDRDRRSDPHPSVFQQNLEDLPPLMLFAPNWYQPSRSATDDGAPTRTAVNTPHPASPSHQPHKPAQTAKRSGQKIDTVRAMQSTAKFRSRDAAVQSPHRAVPSLLDPIVPERLGEETAYTDQTVGPRPVRDDDAY